MFDDASEPVDVESFVELPSVFADVFSFASSSFWSVADDVSLPSEPSSEPEF